MTTKQQSKTDRIRFRLLNEPGFRDKWREKRKRHKQRWRARLTPDRKRNMRLNKYYGISLDIYNDMFAKQNGVCKICGQKCLIVKPNRLPLCVDHCHTTGKVRGLLCVRCNSGIGYLRHDTSILLNAIEYLK